MSPDKNTITMNSADFGGFTERVTVDHATDELFPSSVILVSAREDRVGRRTEAFPTLHAAIFLSSIASNAITDYVFISTMWAKTTLGEAMICQRLFEGEFDSLSTDDIKKFLLNESCFLNSREVFILTYKFLISFVIVHASIISQICQKCKKSVKLCDIAKQ